ncbi:oxidoreductase [Rhodobacterales bacterium 56_14_T64]|nr:oxidoreductase [Rhodobacterales bacterium 56_14_T64]
MAEEKRQSVARVLVLGGYGFIGAEVVRVLRAKGLAVTAAGRDRATAARVLPGVPFLPMDLRQMQAVGDWTRVLAEIDLVVNCVGALQDNSRDDLAAVHHDAIAALAQAAAQDGTRVVQVSAVGALKTATTEFMRSKGRGDDALRATGATVWILRPGLVIGQGAYGGTALLRMLAAVPGVQVLTLATATVQSVALHQVALAVFAAVNGQLPPGEYDLVEDEAQSLSRVVHETRKWLGFTPAKVVLNAPVWMARLIGRAADQLGRLGWRSPLRSTALKVLEAGICGDPVPYRRVMGHGMAPLQRIYAGLPVGGEHRLSARMALMMPLSVAILSLLWLASGVIGLWKIGDAAGHLTAVGWSHWAAVGLVAVWSIVDITLGAAILCRPWAARACLAMVAVSLIYMAASAVFTPGLWGDPLGPMVKVLPATILSLITHQLLQSR